MDRISFDMQNHRKWCLISAECRAMVGNDINHPRAAYYDLPKIEQNKTASYIRLLVQVPDSFSKTITNLIQTL